MHVYLHILKCCVPFRGLGSCKKKKKNSPEIKLFKTKNTFAFADKTFAFADKSYAPDFF